jgi:hypothetical protein
MYEWVRALLDPTDIVQSPSSAKKQITPPPKFEIPADEPVLGQRNRRGRSASPSKLSSPRKSRATRVTKDVTSTPSTTAANANLQSALDITAAILDADTIPELGAIDGETEVKGSGSPSKKPRARKSKRGTTAEPEEEAQEETKEQKKEKKKTEKKEKKKEEMEEIKEESAVEVAVDSKATEDVKTTQTTVSLDMPFSLPEVPSAAETEDMIAQAKSMVEEAIKAQAEGTLTESSVKVVTKKRKSEEDEDEETSAESSQRAKKAKILENKLKQERVRNRSIFGVSVAFALA